MVGAMLSSDNVKAVFYLKGVDAQQHGIRLILTSKLIERHFERDSVWDDPNGIQTEVLLEGDKGEINKFYGEVKDNLLDWINARNRDLDVATRISKNPGVDITLSEIEFNDSLRVHALNLFGHSLTHDEVSKGYNIFLDNIKTNKQLRETLVEASNLSMENTKSNRQLRETLDKLGKILDKKL